MDLEILFGQVIILSDTSVKTIEFRLFCINWSFLLFQIECNKINQQTINALMKVYTDAKYSTSVFETAAESNFAVLEAQMIHGSGNHMGSKSCQ